MEINREYIMENAKLCVCHNEDLSKKMKGQDGIHKELGNTDLELYVRVMVDVPKSDSIASFVLTRKLIESVGISEEEAFYAATMNQNYTFRTIGDVMSEMLDVEMEDSSMFVISNDIGWNGASGIVHKELLDRAIKEFGCEYVYVLPSSIHECLVVAGDNVRCTEMNSMVVAANETTVEEEERLSDHVYIYDSHCRTLRNCPF